MILLFSTLTIFSCNKDTEKYSLPIDKTNTFVPLSNEIKTQIESLNTLYTYHFFSMLSSIEKTRDKDNVNTYDKVKVQNLSNTVLEDIGVEVLEMKKANLSNAREAAIFNEVQISLVDQFKTKLLAINSPSEAMQIAVSFRPLIDKSDLSLEEKYNILAITEYVYIAGKYFSSALNIENNINSKNLRNSSTGCQVAWKEVFAAGVSAGIVGGTAAGYVGATGGTFVVPIVGTVTGAINGFMVGFIAGFTGGASNEVIKSLLLTCGPPKKIVAQKLESCYKYTFEWDTFSYDFFQKFPSYYQGCGNPTIDITDRY